MFIVFGKVFAIFIMIFIGFLANKIKILSNEAIPHITNLMLYVTAPCMAISSIYSKSLSADVIVATVQTMAGAVIFSLSPPSSLLSSSRYLNLSRLKTAACSSLRLPPLTADSWVFPSQKPYSAATSFI